MQNTNQDSLSLVTATPGDTVRVRRILFGAVRSLCQGRGLREGEVVRRRPDVGDAVVLETPSGEALTLDRRWARFIQVEPPPARGPRRSARSRGARSAGRHSPSTAS